jgi:hypothetical protein
MNAGHVSITNALSELSTDLIGNFRPFGSTLPDLGAYERQE